MVTIINGNVYVTTGKVTGNDISGGTTIAIWATKIEYNYDNPFIDIPIPSPVGDRQDNKANDQDAFTRIIDLKRFKEAISLQGHLTDEAGESAKAKRDNLLNLAKREGALTLVWGETPYQTLWKPEENAKDGTGVFILKVSFIELPGIVGDNVTAAPQPERQIDVQLQVVRGKDI